MSKMICLSRIDQHSLLPFLFLISKHCVNILNFDWFLTNRSYILWSKKPSDGIWFNEYIKNRSMRAEHTCLNNEILNMML